MSRRAYTSCSSPHFHHMHPIIQNRIERRAAREIQEYNPNIIEESSNEHNKDELVVGDVGLLDQRRLQTQEPLPWIDGCNEAVQCINGYTADDPTISCAAACGGQCCVGNNACRGFIGLVCKDGYSCMGSNACESANIVSVRGSCNGVQACEKAAAYGGYIGDIAGKLS